MTIWMSVVLESLIKAAMVELARGARNASTRVEYPSSPCCLPMDPSGVE